MAKAATEEQVQLRRRARRRLIGAMALVTVIAVVLPWVLESEPRQNDQDVSIQIPSPESSVFRTKVAPAKPAEVEKPAAKPAHTGAAPQAAEAPADALKSEQDKLLAAPTPKAAAPKPATKEKVAAAAEAKKKPQDRTESGAEGRQYVVQITALADAEKAHGIQQQLLGKGLNAYTEKVHTASGEVTRVRVGPYPNREAAEKERARIKSLGFEGNIAPK